MAVDDTDYELAMRFTDENGKDIRFGEAAMQVDPLDPLMKGIFKPITDYDQFSNFFEVQTFDFRLNVESNDKKPGYVGRKPAIAAIPAFRDHSRSSAGALFTNAPVRSPAGGQQQQPTESEPDAFHRWRSATEAEAREMKWHAQLDEFSFTRVIDGVSPLFFQNCANKVKFKSASLVKRVSRGSRVAGMQRIPHAFLRLDFDEVTMLSIKWNDGELVTETCEFKCNELRFTYRQQGAGGDLKGAETEAKWKREEAAERKATAK